LCIPLTLRLGHNLSFVVLIVEGYVAVTVPPNSGVRPAALDHAERQKQAFGGFSASSR
jgi:hypothetical protein